LSTALSVAVQRRFQIIFTSVWVCVPDGSRNLTLGISTIVHSIEVRISPMKSAYFNACDLHVWSMFISAQVHRDFDFPTSFIPWFPYL
jgi:hypothetical protein